MTKEKKTIKKAEPKSKVSMVSYSIKMVIPTGQYANIQPEIIVKGGTVEEAHDYIAPHMNKLWKEYYLINERRPEEPKKPLAKKQEAMTVEEVAKATNGQVFGGGVPEGTSSAPESPASGVAFVKASQAIEACVSLDALELIQSQVIKSVKLSHKDKENLMPKLEDKSNELFEKNG